MRTNERAVVIAAFVCGAALQTLGAQWPCADNFNDGLRNTNLWGNVVVVFSGDTANLKETNGVVRLVRDNTTDIAVAFQPLSAAIPVTNDWEAQARVHSPTGTFAAGEGIFLGLGLTADTPAQSGQGPVVVMLVNSDQGYAYNFIFDFAACPSNIFSSDIHDKESGIDGWVRLRWKAAVSNLYADYTTDTNLGWRALGGPRSNPLQVTSTNHFILGLCGGSQNRTVTASEDFYLDDFGSVTNPFFGVSAAVITNMICKSTNGALRVWFSSRFNTVYDLQMTGNLTSTNGWRSNNLPMMGDVGPLSLAWASATTGACGFARVVSMDVDAVITNFALAETLLDTPERIRQYIQGHIYWADIYYHRAETNDFALAPTNTFALGYGVCTDQSALFAYLLNHHDDAAHSRFDVHLVRFSWDGLSDNHCIAIYKDTDGQYRYFTDASVYGPLNPTNTVMDALLNFERKRIGYTTVYTNRVYEAPTDPNSNFVFDNLPMNQW